jgi:hypothetical protein
VTLELLGKRRECENEVEGLPTRFHREEQDGEGQLELRDQISKVNGCEVNSQGQSISMTDIAYLVQTVGEGIVCAWSSTDDFPVIDNELVTSRCGFPFWHCLKNANSFYGRLNRECQCVIGLRLIKESSYCLCTITNIL